MPAGKTLVTLAALLAGSLAAYGCHYGVPPGRRVVASASSSNADVLIEDLAMGEGATVETTSTVVVSMVGTLPDGTVIYESESPQGPWPVDGLISGLTIGLKGMALGGRRRITIPPYLAYGDRAVLDERTGETLIPPGSTLIYEIELVEVSNADAAVTEPDGVPN